MKIIIIEGIPSSGKSWTVEKLKDVLNDYITIPDPIRKFEFNGETFNPSALFSPNYKEDVACAQLHSIKSLRETISENFLDSSESDIVVIAGFLTSVEPTVKTMLRLGILSEFSANFVLKELSKAWKKTSEKFEIARVYFLNTEIDLCMDRIENGLHEKHEGFEVFMQKLESFPLEELERYLKKLRKKMIKYYTKMYPAQFKIIENNDDLLYELAEEIMYANI